MHCVLGDVRMFGKQGKHDGCLPFWRGNIVIKAVYTSDTFTQIPVEWFIEKEIFPSPLEGGKKTKLIVEIIKFRLNFLEKGRQEEES